MTAPGCLVTSRDDEIWASDSKNKDNTGSYYVLSHRLTFLRDYTGLTFLTAVAGIGLSTGLGCCEHLLCWQTKATAWPGEECKGQNWSLEVTVWVVLSERDTLCFELQWGLGLWGINCEEEDPGTEVKVWEVGGVLELLALMSTPLGSSFLCMSVMSWADSWSSTYIMWVPTSRLIYIGERPDRKSLTYIRNKTPKLTIMSSWCMLQTLRLWLNTTNISFANEAWHCTRVGV